MMNAELNSIRISFARFVVVLLWLHVPLIFAVALWNGLPWVFVTSASMVLAAVYHLSYLKNGVALSTRYLSAVALMGEPALLVYLMQGHAWQMDMHMYFFAMLALTIGWCDRRPIILAAITVVLHHVILLYVLPLGVFPSAGNFKRVLLHGGIVAFQTGVLVWIADTIEATFYRGHLMSEALIGVNDALEQRTLEAEKANSAKSMFLANMSHEIRTPLNAVLGFCHLLQRSELTARQEDYVTKISSAGTALLRLINDILDFSKNEAGKLTLEDNPFNPHGVIEQQLQMVLVTARAKGLNLTVDPDPNLPLWLCGDELRFGQVILNLVSNAVKFTEQGSVTVRTKLLEDMGDQVNMLVEVVDTGIGMSKEQQDRLFSSFTQADNSMTRRFGGTGLGLAISRQIVNLMGGEISVESRPWEGTTFRFSITVQRYQGQAVDILVPSPKVVKLKVISVDDNPASRQIVKEVFSGWSMSVTTVASGPEFLEQLRLADHAQQPFDLALVDWKMPGMSGLDAVHQVNADPMIQQKPVMMVVTAYGSDQFTKELEGSGVAAYLTKPLEPKVLLHSLHELFDPEQLNAASLSPPGSPNVSPAAMGAANQVPQVHPNLRGQRILLVEDNPINREIASELLTDAGLLLDSCENGQDACDQVLRANGQYGAILMDLQMPVMDGLEASRQIRQHYALNDLPILALTAHAYEEERQRCIDAGMNDHISKPIDPTALVETLNRWLKPVVAQVVSPTNVVPIQAPPDLPQHLPPFDLPKALLRVNGKAGLLRRLIIEFGHSQADVVAQIEAALETGDAEAARRISHTLKGVAGALELADVQWIAGQVEDDIAYHQGTHAPRMLRQLAQVLAPALTAAQSLQGEPAAAAVSTTPVSRTLGEAQELEAMRDGILQQLNKRSLGARASFNALAIAMGLSLDEIACHPVQIALDRLDYETAQNALSALVFESLSVRVSK